MPFGRARRGFTFILGSVVAALLLQGQPASAQEAQSTSPSAAGKTVAPATDGGASSAAVATPQAGAAISSDQPGGTSTLWPAQEIADAIGDFKTSVSIQVPPFHGIEPRLALAYDSGRANGLVGVGWNLTGLSLIERASYRRGGVPSFIAGAGSASDLYLLDGEQMVVCHQPGGPNLSSAGCGDNTVGYGGGGVGGGEHGGGGGAQPGGTHVTRIENFLRVKAGPTTNDVVASWEVTDRDGTRLTYAPLSTWCAYNSGNPDEVKRATQHRWALSTAVDTHNNTVTYSYVCDGVASYYIDTISYNGNSIKFYRETRSDVLTYATGAGLESWRYRLKTIDIKVGGQRVRAYALTYGITQTGRSRLASIPGPTSMTIPAA
ncbi:MAG: SpvB/TcaC N-terminal domain-containing protein [Thermoanaerobaculia bacterium]